MRSAAGRTTRLQAGPCRFRVGGVSPAEKSAIVRNRFLHRVGAMTQTAARRACLCWARPGPFTACRLTRSTPRVRCAKHCSASRPCSSRRRWPWWWAGWTTCASPRSMPPSSNCRAGPPARPRAAPAPSCSCGPTPACAPAPTNACATASMYPASRPACAAATARWSTWPSRPARSRSAGARISWPCCWTSRCSSRPGARCSTTRTTWPRRWRSAPQSWRQPMPRWPSAPRPSPTCTTTPPAATTPPRPTA